MTVVREAEEEEVKVRRRQTSSTNHPPRTTASCARGDPDDAPCLRLRHPRGRGGPEVESEYTAHIIIWNILKPKFNSIF